MNLKTNRQIPWQREQVCNDYHMILSSRYDKSLIRSEIQRTYFSRMSRFILLYQDKRLKSSPRRRTLLNRKPIFISNRKQLSILTKFRNRHYRLKIELCNYKTPLQIEYHSPTSHINHHHNQPIRTNSYNLYLSLSLKWQDLRSVRRKIRPLDQVVNRRVNNLRLGVLGRKGWVEKNV